MFYFLPGVAYRRLKDEQLNRQDCDSQYKLYQTCTRQYLGLGWLMQFVPGTNANKARRQLSESLSLAISSGKKTNSIEFKTTAIPVSSAKKTWSRIKDQFNTRAC